MIKAEDMDSIRLEVNDLIYGGALEDNELSGAIRELLYLYGYEDVPDSIITKLIKDAR